MITARPNALILSVGATVIVLALLVLATVIALALIVTALNA